jgi:serine/threonine protein kinase
VKSVSNPVISSTRFCRTCRSPISAAAPEGLCPFCVLALAINSPSESPPGLLDLTLRIDKFEILEVIGRGAMGIVYKARQKDINRLVAIKTLLAGNLCSDSELRRFRTEAAAAGRLEHPGLIRLYEFGDANGLIFFSMEFVEGVTLDKLLRGTPLPGRRAATYARSIAQAVQYAHERFLLHRDLKPGNVIIDRSDTPRVADFGLAKEMSVPDVSQSGSIIGTPSYMPPEQARGDKDLTPAADVYGIGATLYQMLTGRPPFHAPSVLETLRQTLEANPTPPRAINPDIPRDLNSICLMCLEKEPERRYATARELADDLDRFLRSEPVNARPIGPSGRLSRYVRRKPFHAAATFAVFTLLLLMAISALLVRREILRTNQYTARVSAQIVASYLQSLSKSVVLLANDLAFRSAVASTNRSEMERLMRIVMSDPKSLFPPGIIETLTTLDTTGERVARLPEFGNISSRSMRDYFRGPMAQPTQSGAYFSRLYVSQQDSHPRFGISRAILHPADNKPVGVLLMGIAIGTLDNLGLNDPQQVTAVVGEWDPSVRPGRAIWLHPAYANVSFGRSSPIVNISDSSFGSANWFYWHTDPAGRTYSKFRGPWLPGFAPVPGTHFLVVVQSRDWVGLSILGGVLAVLLLTGVLVIRACSRGQADAETTRAARCTSRTLMST